jgi:hypothetical protein
MDGGIVTDFDGLRFVVARFNEDLGWVPEMVSRFPGSRCTVYNKGPPGDLGDLGCCNNTVRVVDLVNVGRESHTYLHHIVDSYDNYDNEGDEVLVFLQGHPFDHCPALFDTVRSGVVKIMAGSSFEDVGTRHITIHQGFPEFHPAIRLALSQTHADLFACNLPESFRFSAGALFMTTSSSIHRRPVGFYEKALAMLDSEINPTRGFCFERLWSLIFTRG